MGQLTNLYVSQSYQGLLKMTDSSNGLTNSLQTIQTGDGDNSPLQMSLTQVNISGSFFINNVPITNGTNGTSGSSGSDGTNGSSGSSGSDGSSGSNGTDGSSGTSGSNGTNGSSGTSGLGFTAQSVGQSFVTDCSIVGTNVYFYVADVGAFAVGNFINIVDQISGSTFYYTGKITLIQYAGGFGWAVHMDVLGCGGTPISSPSSSWLMELTGASGTSGSSGTSGDSLFAQTGSYWATTNDLQITGSLGITNIIGTGSLFLQPDQGDPRFLQVYNTSPTDTHITASGGQIYLGNDITYVKVDNYGSVKHIDIVADNGLNVSGSLTITGSVDITGTYSVNGVPIGGGGDRNGLITTGSVGLIQSITGSLNLTSITTLGTGTTPSTPNSSTGTLLIFSGDDINGAANPSIYNIANDNGVGWVMSGPGITDGTVTSAGYGDNTVEVNITSGNVVSGSSYTGTGPYYPYLNITGSVYSSNGFTSPGGLTIQNADGSGVQYGGVNINCGGVDQENIFSTFGVSNGSSEGSLNIGLSSYTSISSEPIPTIYAGGYYNGDDTTMTFYSGSIDMWKPTRFRAPITGSLNVKGNIILSGSLTTTNNIVFSGSNYITRGEIGIVNSQTLSITNTGLGGGYLQSGSAIQLTYNTGSGGVASFQMNANVSGSSADLAVNNNAGTTTIRGLAKEFLFAKSSGFPNTAANSFEVDATNIKFSGSTNITGSLSINSGSLNVPSRINFTTGFVPTYIEALGDTFDIYSKNFGLTTDSLIITTTPSAPVVQTIVSSSALPDGIFNSHLATYDGQGIGFAWSTYNSIPENSLSANFYGPGVGNHESPYGGNDDVVFQFTTGSNVVDWYRDMNFSGSLNMSGSLTLRGGLNIASGSNKTMGTVALNGGNPGTATVSNSLVTTSSMIFLTKQTYNHPQGQGVSISSKGAGTFTITSNHNGDTDVVAYQIINPA